MVKCYLPLSLNSKFRLIIHLGGCVERPRAIAQGMAPKAEGRPMFGSRVLLLVLPLAIFGITGCNAARCVHVDPDGGIVAIPSNTNSWPYYHRDKAEALIRQKCPTGFEIVSETEVVTGQTSQTDSQTDTQQAPALAVGGLAVPLGQSQQNTQQTTRTTDVTEWRIQYRRK